MMDFRTPQDRWLTLVLTGAFRTNKNLGIPVHDNNEIDTLTLDYPVDVYISLISVFQPRSL